MSKDLFPYLVKVRFPPSGSNPNRECAMVILSEIKPNGRGKPDDFHAFCVEVLDLVSTRAQVLEADIMVWALSHRAVYLDDSAKKIKEYLA